MYLDAFLFIFWLTILRRLVREVIVLESIVVRYWDGRRVLFVPRRIISHFYCSLRLFLLVRGAFKLIDLVKVDVCSVVLQLIDSDLGWFFRLRLLLIIMLYILVRNGVIVLYFIFLLLIIFNFFDLVHGHDLITLIDIPFGPSFSMIDLFHLQEIVQMHLCLTCFLNLLQQDHLLFRGFSFEHIFYLIIIRYFMHDVHITFLVVRDSFSNWNSWPLRSPTHLIRN